MHFRVSFKTILTIMAYNSFKIKVNIYYILNQIVIEY